MTYGDFKDLTRRPASGKTLRDKAFNIAKNSKYDGYQRDLASVVYKFFDKKSASLADKSTSGCGIKNENMLKKELAEELHKLKPVIRKFKKRKVYSSFIDNIWGANSADMRLISKFIIDFYDALLVFSVNMHGLFL